MGIRIIAKAIEATMAGNWFECSSDEGGRLVLGRHKDCDMVLCDPSVEPRHACFDKTDKAWTIRCLGSGGVLLNGVSLAPDLCVPVSPGDDIQIGIFAVSFWLGEIHKGSKNSALDEAVDPIDSIRLTSSLDVVNGPLYGRSVGLAKGTQIMIGRARDCDLVLDDSRVSRKHARIVNRDGTIWVYDLDSSNGVAVNGTRVSERKRLRPGDVLGMGHYKVQMCLKNTRDDSMGWARVMALPRVSRPVELSSVGLLCLALSMAACAAAFMI